MNTIIGVLVDHAPLMIPFDFWIKGQEHSDREHKMAAQ